MSGKNCTECHGAGWLDSEGEPRTVARNELTPNGVHHCDHCGGSGWEPVVALLASPRRSQKRGSEG